MIPLDLIATLGGLIIPPAFDFIKKKFVKGENDTPERTMGSLAVTNPEVLPAYVKSLSEFFRAKIDFFNRDVIGQPGQWVVNLRAAIRPITVVFSGGILGVMVVYCLITNDYTSLSGNDMLTGVRLSCESNISAWIGDRFKTHR